ncbi:MAG: hypothetical protein KAT09_03210 [Candidatus Aegiribacteria sp.]|nr:hypothetical protein [Candidatus Aegiribacteria sp.]
MYKLSVDELDLLQRVEEKEELRPLFFQKVKGIKWFDALSEKGYFSPEANPKPVPAKEEGYVSIPYWLVVDYLVKTSKELTNDNIQYAEKFLKILVNVTNYAKENGFSNYHTWWEFAKIISEIPYQIIRSEIIDIVDYWLEDEYERDLIAKEIGCKWLPKLLSNNDDHAFLLSLKILGFLYKTVLLEKIIGGKIKRECVLRFNYYYAQKITKRVARLAGEKVGRDAIIVFDTQLRLVMRKKNNDAWSDLWQPAIEVHEQNKHWDDTENILVEAYRDSLSGYIRANIEEAYEYIKGMMSDEYQTIHRLAIHAISTNFRVFSSLIDELLDDRYLESNYRHEMWHLLNSNYQRFSETQKEETLSLIASITRTDNDGNLLEAATAFNKAIWLSAIKKHGKKEIRLYKENVAIAKTEPDHPDFSCYMTAGLVEDESPIPLEKLQAYSIEDLIEVLASYRDPGQFREPDIKELAKAFKEVVRIKSLSFYNQLNKFVKLDFIYIHTIIEAYREFWVEKKILPWNDIWPFLLRFCSTVIKQDRFWDPENSIKSGPFIANRHWIVSSISKLLEAGSKSDDHAFNEEYLDDAEKIIAFLLEKEEGSEYRVESDTVSISINSPRGHCLEALINLTLRSCRLSDKMNNKDHSDVWAHFQPLYDDELNRTDVDNPMYEFATLVTMYLENFLYMSEEWVLGNLSRIFDQEHYQKWLCAMQGYAYVRPVYKEIYQYLKRKGDFLKVLDDENVKNRIEKKVIKNIAIAYINDFESYSDDNSLINTLIVRNDYEELKHLIWFICSLREEYDKTIQEKEFELWIKILDTIDLSTKESKRIASQLCHWATFIDQIDDEKRDLLHKIAPYADEAYNADELLKSIAKLSEEQPFEAYVIWMKMLEGSSTDYPEEVIRQILFNLVSEGHEGLRRAKEVVSEYLKLGNDRPATWLKEIRSRHESC